ncbi:MAG TPA: hypothetical protein VJ964_03345 [Balneolaceae bacterium]|nr:hypothetical protein [Balneolaceae bacterium]
MNKSVPNPTYNNALHPRQRKPPVKRAGGDLPFSVVNDYRWAPPAFWVGSI